MMIKSKALFVIVILAVAGLSFQGKKENECIEKIEHSAEELSSLKGKLTSAISSLGKIKKFFTKPKECNGVNTKEI